MRMSLWTGKKGYNVVWLTIRWQTYSSPSVRDFYFNQHTVT